jgi:hypothetical protein
VSRFVARVYNINLYSNVCFFKQTAHKFLQLVWRFILALPGTRLEKFSHFQSLLGQSKAVSGVSLLSTDMRHDVT